MKLNAIKKIEFVGLGPSISLFVVDESLSHTLAIFFGGQSPPAN